MLLSDFDFALPDELIARYPPDKRRASRLLEVGDTLVDRYFGDLPKLLRAGDLLVFNDTRVIPARLAARKETGGRAEILIERITGSHVALALVRASKSPKPGTRLLIDDAVAAEVSGREDDLFELVFRGDVMEILDAHGDVPLPPYLERDAEPEDVDRYQTVYARDPGAVAAPTAGLHFDEAMLEETLSCGVRHAFITLHVGAGTFQPLRNEQIEENRLHSERVEIGEQSCALVNQTRRDGGRVIAVGTTAVRALESAYASGDLAPFRGETELFIRPGFDFCITDAMITNFHLPRSSLLMLVAAFAGTDRILAAYRHAVHERYRFFSYGDCMFVTRGPCA